MSGEALGEKSAPAPFLEPYTEANTMGSNMLLLPYR
ncbi:BnaA04g11480D [Brassica napus]|uniref:BnaA04g11480D protein n=1 Tax=Brassica napus TaxID=3708 RepID=A0A078IIT0_BRANA|nr:BnaA04g11480D [Brassica napus]